MDAINLNAGVTIKTLYKDLDADKIKQIEEASTDGFTEDELQKLEDSGIDTTLIKNNSTAATADGKDTTATKKEPEVSVADKAKEIKEKYCAGITASTGDKYNASNPELTAFSKAMDDGLIKELGEAGYSKNDIVDIINQAFPSIGIENTDGGKYSCPYGHGDEAKAIYNKFVEELTSATSGNSAELIEAQNKLFKISKEITDNNRSLRALEYNITMLQDSIEEKIEDAIEESKDIVEDQQEDAKDIVAKRLNEYTSSNGEMTYEEFQKKVGSDLDELSGGANSKLSSSVAKIMSAQRDMNVLSGYISKMNGLVESNSKLSTEAKSIQDQIKTIGESAKQGSDEDCNRCDPIGFTDNDGTRYDFFVDKDSDGNVTNENEFLGAEDGFKEMMNADADNDGKVTASELDSKNVKVIVTNADGTQEVKNASEVLGDNDNIDLSSYQAQNTELANGNALLGTFNVNKDGETLDGYQTLDKLDWLDDNFEFSDEINGTGRHVGKEGDVAEALDYASKASAFQEKFNQLQTKEQSAEVQLGLDSSEVKSGIANAAETEANRKADRISTAFEKTKSKEARQAEETRKAAEEARQTNNKVNVNGEIDEKVVQGKTGDCWILSTVLALNSTKEGKQLIKESIKVNADESVTVTFKGADKSYTISKQELQKHDTDDNTKDEYSNGDNDMLAIELATEKLYEDVRNGSVTLGSQRNNDAIKADLDGTIEGGDLNVMSYLLTGKETTGFIGPKSSNDSGYTVPKEDVSGILSEAASHEPVTAAFGVKGSGHTAKLTNGQTYTFDTKQGHGFAITDIDTEKQTATFVNPWDSSTKYTISWDELAKLGVHSIQYTELDKQA